MLYEKTASLPQFQYTFRTKKIQLHVLKLDKYSSSITKIKNPHDLTITCIYRFLIYIFLGQPKNTLPEVKLLLEVLLLGEIIPTDLLQQGPFFLLRPELKD